MIRSTTMNGVAMLMVFALSAHAADEAERIKQLRKELWVAENGGYPNVYAGIMREFEASQLPIDAVIRKVAEKVGLRATNRPDGNARSGGAVDIFKDSGDGVHWKHSGSIPVRPISFGEQRVLDVVDAVYDLKSIKEAAGTDQAGAYVEGNPKDTLNSIADAGYKVLFLSDGNTGIQSTSSGYLLPNSKSSAVTLRPGKGSEPPSVSVRNIDPATGKPVGKASVQNLAPDGLEPEPKR